MNLTGFTALQSASVDSTNQTALVVANTQPIINLLGNSNLLSVAQVNAILIALDGNGLLNGTVNLAGQTPIAPPTGAGTAAVISLLAKFWSVTVDSIFSVVIVSDGEGGFWRLVVDTGGNIGTVSDAGPQTADVVLADGFGGFWKIVVDSEGNRGTVSDAGPATVPAPVIDDGSGGLWTLVVDDSGNLGATI